MISRTVADLVEKNKGIKSELFPDPGYEIIDNYIPEDELKKIQDLLILNHQFPWFRSHTVAWNDTVKDDITPEHLSYFGHILYGNFNERDRNANTSRSEYFEQQTADQMTAVDNDLMKEQHPSMPITKDRQSRVTFGGPNTD